MKHLKLHTLTSLLSLIPFNFPPHTDRPLNLKALQTTYIISHVYTYACVPSNHSWVMPSLKHCNQHFNLVWIFQSSPDLGHPNETTAGISTGGHFLMYHRNVFSKQPAKKVFTATIAALRLNITWKALSLPAQSSLMSRWTHMGTWSRFQLSY